MKKRSIRQKALVISAAAIIAATAVYGTAAYFTAESTARNVITAGSVKIELQERALGADGAEKPFEDVVGVLPGETVSKIACVKNTGDSPAWVRVSVAKSIELAAGAQGETDVSLVGMDMDTENWSERDGFWYYNRALAPGETTKPLFTSVSFHTSMGDMYQQSRAVISVNAYATQTANNGATALEAAGWQETE